jgi:hypothetical protein
MLITYRPAGGEPRDWSFQPRELSSLEAEDVEDATGYAFPLFQSQFYAGRTRARRAVLWVLLRREDPALRFDDVQYGMAELGFHWDGGTETTELARQVEIDPDIDEETRTRILAELSPPAPPSDGEAAAGGEAPLGSATEPVAAASSG